MSTLLKDLYTPAFYDQFSATLKKQSLLLIKRNSFSKFLHRHLQIMN